MSSTVSRFSIIFLSAQLVSATTLDTVSANTKTHLAGFASTSANVCFHTALAQAKAPSTQSQLPAIEAERILRDAVNLLLKGSPVEALNKYQEAQSLFQRAGDDIGQVRSLYAIGEIYDSLGQEQRSVAAYEQALYFVTTIDEKRSQAKILNKLAVVYQEIGNTQKALNNSLRSLALVQGIGDRGDEATILGNIAFLYKSAGESTKSLEYYSRALELMKSSGDRHGEARILNNLGALYSSLGDREKALTFFNQALTIWRDVRDLDGLTSTLNNLGETYAAVRRTQESLEAYNQALNASLAGSHLVRDQSTVPFFKTFRFKTNPEYHAWLGPSDVWNSKRTATTINNLAQVYSSVGRKEDAIILLQQAAYFWRRLGDRKGEATALDNLAVLFQSSGDQKTASNLRDQAATLLDSLAAIRSSAGKPTLHILSIGNGRYPKGPRVVRPSLKYPLWNIPMAIKDAHDFSQTLKSSARDFEDVKTHVLINGSKAEIFQAFEKIISEIQPRDTFIFNYSGQGFSQAVAGTGAREFYIMPSDFSARVGARGAISTAVLLAFMTRIQAQRRFIVIDARESSAGFDRMAAAIGGDGKLLRGLLQRDVALITLSEGARVNLVEGEGKNNGLLTYALLKGMRGAADLDGNGVSVRETIEYARSYVKERLPTIPNLVWYQRQVEVKNFVSGDDFPLTRNYASGARMSRAHASGPPHNEIGRSRLPLNEARPIQDRQTKLDEILGQIDTVLSKAPRPRTGKDYALLIASNNYDQWSPLTNPIDDAKAVAKKLNQYYGFETELLEHPTRDEIFDAIRKYKNQLKYAADDQLLVFLAGHGTYIEDFRDGYIIAKDSLKDDANASTYVSYSQLRHIIDQIPNNHILLVIDACFGGTFDEWISRKQHHYQYPDATNAEFIDRKMRIRTRRLITSGGKQYVSDGRPGEHSPFVNRLLKALDTRGGSSGVLTIADITPFIQRLDPEPVIGDWGGNERRSEFLFIAKNPEEPRAKAR